MKKLVLFLVLLLALTCIAACGDASKKTPDSDATITLTDGNGEKVDIDVDEFTDVSEYKIVRSDTASMLLKSLVNDVKAAIEEKTGVTVETSTDWSTSSVGSKEIIIGKTKDSTSTKITEELGISDFAIRHIGNKVYISGGSEEAITEAVKLFIKCFIYAENKSILLPVDEGYTYLKKYAFDKLSVEGVDIREFMIYAKDTESVDYTVIKTEQCAEELSAMFKDVLLGEEIKVAKEMGTGHYIVLCANSLDVDGYSVKVENGNIYIDGSFTTIEEALDAFVTEMLGYKESEASLSRTLDLSGANNVSGSLDYTVPYTKDDLIKLFNEAYDSKSMVLSGTQAYKASNHNGWIGSTSDEIYAASGQRPAIIEIDVGRHSVYYDYYRKGDTITPYDLSSFVAESAEHVSNGGIVGVCIHMANPLMNASDSVWYRGHLGSEEVVLDMLTDGTEMNKALRKTLESTFMVLEEFKKNDIPFIFRPLHEMNGGWFWWCVDQGSGTMLSQQTMQDFWKFFYKVVTDEMGIDNAVWVYAPNYDTGGVSDVLYAYPGDEYVDIVGCDWYTNGNYEVNNKDSYTKVMSTGKPAALTEVGPASGGALSAIDEDGNTYYTWTCEDLLGAIKDMIRDDYKLCYFLTWTYDMSIARLGNANILMNDEVIMTRADVMSYWENLD